MALQKSGSISFGNIADEFKRHKKNFSLSSLYKDTINRKGNLNIVKNIKRNINVPISGKISASNFYNSINYYTAIQVSASKENNVKSTVPVSYVLRYDGWHSASGTRIWQAHWTYQDVWSNPNDASFTVKLIASNPNEDFFLTLGSSVTVMKSAGIKRYGNLDGGTVYYFNIRGDDTSYTLGIKPNDQWVTTINIA
jgi:hypothetical protein